MKWSITRFCPEKEREGGGPLHSSTPLLFRCIFLPIFRPSVSASFLNRRVIRFRSTARLRFVRLLWLSSAWNNFAKGFDLFGRVARPHVYNTLHQTVMDVENRKLRESKLKNMIYNLMNYSTLKIKLQSDSLLDSFLIFSCRKIKC